MTERDRGDRQTQQPFIVKVFFSGWRFFLISYVVRTLLLYIVSGSTVPVYTAAAKLWRISLAEVIIQEERSVNLNKLLQTSE